MALVQHEAEVGCQGNTRVLCSRSGVGLFGTVHTYARARRHARSACARTSVGRGAVECMAMGWRVGGVAAEAAGRTPASLLAPGAPLLSK